MSRKDSRLRTVQRDRGKVFVEVFGIRYQPQVDTQTELKVGDDVLIVEGSTPEGITLLRQKDLYIDRHWRPYGVVGGEKAKPKALEQWAKFMAGEKSHGMTRVDPDAASDEVNKEPAKERLAAAKEPKAHGELPDMAEIRELAKDYDFDLMIKRVVVQFPDRSGATAFKIAATKRGWKTSTPSTDENTGKTEVLVQSK